VAVAVWLISVVLSGPVGGTTAFSRGVRGLAPLSLALAAPSGLALALALRTQTRRLAAVAVAAVAVLVLFSSAASATRALHRQLAPRTAFPLLSCPALRAAPGQTIAYVPLDRRDESSIQMALFADTGAYLLYANRPRLRFGGAFRDIPSQQQRLAQLAAMASGGAAPPGVDAVLREVAGRDGACRYGHHRLALTVP
jgi:hypothetical protein